MSSEVETRRAASLDFARDERVSESGTWLESPRKPAFTSRVSDPAVFTIPIHHPFADALAAGLLARAGADRLALARAIVLLPNNRAQRAITDAFVRRAHGGLLLPRLVSIGDLELDDRLGPALDPADGDAVPPAIDPVARQLILARLVGEARAAG